MSEDTASSRAQEKLLKDLSRSWVNGRAVSATGKSMAHRNPATDADLGDTEMMDQAGVDAAVGVARACFEQVWSRLTPLQRKTKLLAFADLVDRHAAELTLLETLEVGRPHSDAAALNATAGGLIRNYAGMVDKVHGDLFRAEERRLGVVWHRPRGVVGAISPWNVPVMNVLLRVAPALGAGNTIVIKPSELSPRSAVLLAKLATEAGLPDGAFNVILGSGPVTGSALAAHRDVDLMAFTGSSRTGHEIARLASQGSFKPLLLECGGKSPQIVLDDAFEDPQIWPLIFFSAFWNTGQWCVAKTRLIVPRGRERETLEGLQFAAKAWPVGDPMEDATKLGPLASRGQLERVLGYYETARQLGTVTDLGCPRGAVGNRGCFVAPSVVTGMPRGSVLSKEEVFGPLLNLELFDDIDGAIALANDTEFGLSASIWTARSDHAYKLARSIKAGGISVYASPEAARATGPELGTSRYFEPQKNSGVGIDGGLPGFLAYTTSQSVAFFN
jgi:gamma-glutamyl-gamma-aminobutyraldehyde dehydrogenase